MVPIAALAEESSDASMTVNFYYFYGDGYSWSYLTTKTYTSADIGVTFPSTSTGYAATYGWEFHINVFDSEWSSVVNESYDVTGNTLTQKIYDHIYGLVGEYLSNDSYTVEIDAKENPDPDWVCDYTSRVTLCCDGSAVTTTTTLWYGTTDWQSKLYYLEMTVGQTCKLTVEGSPESFVELNSFTAGPDTVFEFDGANITATAVTSGEIIDVSYYVSWSSLYVPVCIAVKDASSGTTDTDTTNTDTTDTDTTDTDTTNTDTTDTGTTNSDTNTSSTGTTTTTDSTSSAKDNVPATGETDAMAAMLVIAALGAAGMLYFRKRKRS